MGIFRSSRKKGGKTALCLDNVGFVEFHIGVEERHVGARSEDGKADGDVALTRPLELVTEHGDYSTFSVQSVVGQTPCELVDKRLFDEPIRQEKPEGRFLQLETTIRISQDSVGIRPTA